MIAFDSTETCVLIDDPDVDSRYILEDFITKLELFCSEED